VACFKIHKEACAPQEPKPEDTVIAQAKTNHSEQDDPKLPYKVEKEYNLLSPGQLVVLRASFTVKLTIERNKDLIARLNSPTLKPLLRNLLKGIPTEIDLTEVDSETEPALETALRQIHQVRTEESGPVVTELECLMSQIFAISGEYRQ
jgi:hypothetical protein